MCILIDAYNHTVFYEDEFTIAVQAEFDNLAADIGVPNPDYIQWQQMISDWFDTWTLEPDPQDPQNDIPVFYGVKKKTSTGNMFASLFHQDGTNLVRIGRVGNA